MQSTVKCAVIKEKVKRFIAERNAHEGATGSGSGDMDAPSTPATEVPTEDDTGAPGVSTAQEWVDN